jgi:hypothetical protein
VCLSFIKEDVFDRLNFAFFYALVLDLYGYFHNFYCNIFLLPLVDET